MSRFRPRQAASLTSPPQAKFPARLAWGIALINLLVIGMVVFSLSHSHDQAEARARITVENLSELLGENITGSIDKIDLALQVAADEYARQLASDKVDAAGLTEFLGRQLGRLPAADNLRAMDPQGLVLYGLGVPTAPYVNLSDRDFYLRHRDNPAAGLVIGKPILARIAKKWLVPLSRRVNKPDGSFGGVVYSAFSIEYFNKMFAGLELGSGGVVSLRDAEMGLIARHPERKAIGIDVGSKLVSRELQQLLQAGQTGGTYFTLTGSDNIARIVAFHKLGDRPLFIVVGVGTDDYLAEWRKEGIQLAGLAGLFVSISAIFAAMIQRAWKSQIVATEALAEQELKFRTIADYTYDWEYWQGLGGELLYISPSCQRITGYSPAEFTANPRLLYDIIVADDRPSMSSHLADIRHEDNGTLDFRIVTKDGDIRWIAHGCRGVFGRDGNFLGRRANNRDITDRKNVEQQVQQLAYFDTLTGLPNRRMLLDRLDRALAQAKRFGRSLAIMFLDLDNFKRINDTLGHDVGDELLKEVAVRLATCIRSGDTVARQGGDEFIIVLAEIAEPRDAALVAEKIVAVLAGDPVRIAGQVLEVTMSIGIALYPINGVDDVQELMKKADQAMYAAKAAGRNGYRFFEG